MFVRTAHLLVGCALFAASRACAQNDITVDSRPTSQDIVSWLGSGDPRLIAWGAHFAQETGDDSATPQMVKLLEEWRPGESGSDSAAWARLGISYVLDALIVRNRQVTTQAVLAINTAFPTEALILISKLPPSEATPLLLNRYEERKTDKNSTYPRIAAMLLSKNPPPGFAASIVAETEVKLDVEITLPDRGSFGGGGGSMVCGDGGAAAPRPGWPPLFLYQIEENSSQANALTLVSAGGDRVTYNRLSASDGWGSCLFPQPLTPETRFHLVAAMLSMAPKEMPWQPRQSTTIAWRSDEQYLLELQDVIAKQETGFETTARALLNKQLLTDDEAKTVRPRLNVSVLDDRYPELPHLRATNARTAITYKLRTTDPTAGSSSAP